MARERGEEKKRDNDTRVGSKEGGKSENSCPESGGSG